jgi:hypothetical protein
MLQRRANSLHQTFLRKIRKALRWANNGIAQRSLDVIVIYFQKVVRLNASFLGRFSEEEMGNTSQ